MQLHELKSPVGSRKRRKIVGRGRGSGHGKTSCRGENGQLKRGHRLLISTEGGQMPLIRRIPKLGFRSKSPLLHQTVNLDDLSRKFDKGSTVTGELLKSKGLIKSMNHSFKILGDGEIKKPLTVQTQYISKTAQDKIIKAGGKVELVGVVPEEPNQAKK